MLWTLAVLPWGLALALVALPLQTWRTSSPRLQRGIRQLITLYGRGTLFWLRPWIPVRMEHCVAAPSGPCIIVANHQSFLDLYLLGAQTRTDLCLVSKTWPYRLLFFFAPIMRLAGYVDVERLPAQEAQALCLERLRQGAALVIFPEGRRSRDGSLGRFHAGAFALACQAQVPVVPLVIHNSFVVFPVGAKKFTPCPIQMRLLEPVPPQAFEGTELPHRAMLRHVRGLFAAHVQPAPTAKKENV